MPTDNRTPAEDALPTMQEGEGGAPRWELFLFHPRDGVRIAPLPPGRSVVVGRSETSDVVFARSDGLSRRHASFSAIGDEVYVDDLQSLNGTSVNGRRIDGRTPFQVGDRSTLGPISAWLQRAEASSGRAQSLEGHESFLDLVQVELDRAREFGRSLAVLMLQGTSTPGLLTSPWIAHVKEHLRVVDRVALFAPDAVEVLLPEATASKAVATAYELVEKLAHRTRVLCGVAMGPTRGRSADDLVEAARAAALRATAARPVEEFEPPIVMAATAGDGGTPVVCDPAMVRLYGVVDTIARTSIAILIVGDTGTGKEVVAREIHARSARRAGPLRVINCGAIAPNLLESELFGHEKGSFTGADRRRIGVFEEADGGTVFLDEIGELSLAAQVALLRVLDRGTIQRVGSSVEIPVDIRVIAATHRDLDAMCREGLFRLDLLFRLTPMRLRVPPLRERRSELRPLVARFIQDFNKKDARAIRGITDQAMARIEAHDWPGNVRELRNEIERAVVMSPGDLITADVLPERIGNTTPPSPDRRDHRPPEMLDLRARVRQVELELLRGALAEAGDNQTRAARLLGMSRRTFIDKMQQFDLRRGDHPAGALPPAVDDAGRPLAFSARIARFEETLVNEALARASGDLTEAARLLRIQPRTLRKWVSRAAEE